MKLNINKNLFEQIYHNIVVESDDKLDTAKHIFNLLISPDPTNVELAKQYIAQDYFRRKYMKYLDEYCIQQTFGNIKEMLYLMDITGMSWFKLL